MRAWSRAREQIVASGLPFDEQVTSYAGQAVEVTREALNNGVTRIIAVGGDGTISEVMNGYLDYDGEAINKDAAIGLLPSGTGSDFRRSVWLDSTQDVVRTLTTTATRLIDAARADFHDDAGRAAARHFINVASFGLGGDAAAAVNRWRATLPRWVGGRVRFAAAALVALGRYKNVPVSMRLDDIREIHITSNLIVVANGKFAGGGMMLAPNAALDNGALDVIVTDGATRWDVIKELPGIHRGGHLKNPRVSSFRARSIAVNAERPMALDLDGEIVGYTPAHLRVLPSAVRLLI